MTYKARHKLIEIEWPEFGKCSYPQQASCEEFQSRIDATRFAMDKRGLSHLVIYGDREHFANLAYLTGFDPRFEEAILVLGCNKTPLLVVGNECMGYLGISPLWASGKLRSERFQPFSLLSQPREDSRRIKDIFSEEGIRRNSTVGCAGWKYFSAQDHSLEDRTIEIPAYVVDTLRDLTSHEIVVNATDILMHPGYGLRTFCSPSEITYFEYTNILASEGMKQILFGISEGMEDHDLAQLAGYNGEPLGCHMTMKVGNNHLGLSGPRGEKVRRGSTLSANVCYWGSNCCRAGWVARSAADLPLEAQGYVSEFAGPYFEAMTEWFHLLRIGQQGWQLEELIRTRLPYENFQIFLNPGHLIHLDEWVSSPIYRNSVVPIHSGMIFQSDIIPYNEIYFSTRMEDGYVIADDGLRRRLQAHSPSCYDRCQKRRKFMTDTLGIELPEEILPLSNMAGILPPYLFAPNLILALET